MFKIGVVGYSSPQFEESAAKQILQRSIDRLLIDWDVRPNEVELVSGLTNIGISKLAYEIADKLGMTTVGLSAEKALKAECGLYPVTKQMIIGKNYGDESEGFVSYIDALIRVGGGAQSLREAQLFKERFANVQSRRTRIIERDLEP